MSSPPQRKEVAPPREEKGRPSGPSTHREFGIAPQHPGQSGTPPAQKKELGPSGQTSRPTPPAIRREPGPPAQMTKPVPPAPKGPTGGPSVQRNMGVAPPHVGKPSAPPAQNRPQGARPGTPHTDTKDSDKR
jgi:hypothetical protein